MTAMRCRVEKGGDICGQDAAVGVVTTSVDIDAQDILEFFPVCAEHAPEELDELAKSSAPEEFAVVTLAYGTVGDLT
jgi:hypothetical protein